MNGYFGGLKSLSHPCFVINRGFVCPICDEVFSTQAPMEKHYLSHNPTQEEASEYVSWKTYIRHYKTPEYYERQEQRKLALAIIRHMRSKGFHVIPKSSFLGKLGFSFRKEKELITWEGAKEAYEG